MQALHDIVKAGYVRYIGMSSCYAWQCEDLSTYDEIRTSNHGHDAVHMMQSKHLYSFASPQFLFKLGINLTDYAITHNLTPFISMQNHYNILYREEEREMMPTLKVRVAPPSALPSTADATIITSFPPFPQTLSLTHLPSTCVHQHTSI